MNAEFRGTSGPGWPKERLCGRYGDFVPGPDLGEIAPDQVKTYEERPLERLLDDRLWRSAPLAFTATSSARRCWEETPCVRKPDAEGRRKCSADLVVFVRGSGRTRIGQGKPRPSDWSASCWFRFRGSPEQNEEIS
jgi:hypothetical protein